MKTEEKNLSNRILKEKPNFNFRLNLQQPTEMFLSNGLAVPKTIFPQLIKKIRNRKRTYSPEIIYLEMIPQSKKQSLLQQVKDLFVQLENIKADLYRMKSS